MTKNFGLTIFSTFFFLCLSAQNNITATTIELHVTFHQVGIQVNYTGDLNNNATASLEANINGTGFKQMHRLSRVGNNRFVGTVFSVLPSTNVTVRVTFSDNDGVVNGVLNESITTRSEQYPTSNVNEIYVSTTGNDNTGNGSTANPYKTIQKAVDLAIPGTKIKLHSGTYFEEVEIAYKTTTTENTPITITNAGDGTVIIDGTNQIFNNPNAWANEGNNVYSISLHDTYNIGIDGNRLWRYSSLLDLQNLIYNTDGGFYSNLATSTTYLKLPGNATPAGHEISVSTLKHAFDVFEANHIIFDGLTFKNYNSEEHASTIQFGENSIRNWVVNCVFENSETFVRVEGFVEDLVVMGNEFSDQGVNIFDWNNIKDHQHWFERGALYIGNDGFTGRGIIFYQNNVHHMFDGVKIVGSEEDTTNYPVNNDVEENTFYYLSDDGIEVDGFACNIRILNNRFDTMLVGVSVAPAIAGPTYIVKNLMVNLQNLASEFWDCSAVKFSYDGERYGEIFIYHNTASTFESEQSAISISNDANWDHLEIKNNIWYGTLFGFYIWLDNINDLTIVEDYDLLYSTETTLVLYTGVEYFSIPEYIAGVGQCTNCLEGDPLFENLASGDYHLTQTSPAINKGIIIPGINDGFVGSNPDIGAYEYQSVVGIDDDIISENLQFYPIPTRDELNLSITNQNFNYQIYSINGQLIQSGKVGFNKINVAKLSTGIYIVKLINTENQKQYSVKMIKK